MSKDQATPTIVINQPSLDQVDESESNSRNRGKSNNVGRSNSAPQAQNKFSPARMGLKSKDSPQHHKGSTTHQGTTSPIPTLSDGVIHASQDQLAASLPSDANLFNCPSHAPLSSTPLCDENHSPSSTRNCYDLVNRIIEEDPRPGDVWQRRDHFGSSGHADNIDSTATSVNGNGTDYFQFTNENSNDNAGHGSNYSQHGGHPSTTTGDGSNRNATTESREGTPEDSPLRKSPGRHPFRQAKSEVLPGEMSRKMSIADMNQKGYTKLEEELGKAQRALALKDEEVDELRGIRERLMKEVSDFTASLFEEVNSQLNTAALGEQQAKRQLQEANCKIEVLSAEVAALKDLVLTSTPSSPNKHLHPQIDTSHPSKKEKGGKPFWKTHRRSTSHHQFTQEAREMAEAKQSHSELKEMDTVAFDEFSRWRLQPCLDFTTQFLTRVQQEDIQPCLNFRNTQLSERLLVCVQNNSLSIEPIPGDSSFPRKCSLSETHKLCNYKIRLEGCDEWYSISPMCRNRIAAVCDFFTYIRYIIQGLVKSSEKDMFAHLVKLRQQMARARLGLL